MLHEFIALNRDAIIARTRSMVAGRAWPSVSRDELEHGVPMFLSQLVETLRLENTDTPFSPTAIGSTASVHGGKLQEMGFNVSQVVHDYGDTCQAITGLAVEQNAPITVDEFQTLNRSLDTAIADAVTEHGRLSSATRSADEAEQLGHAAHELRDILNSALLAFHMLRRGTVAINGSTGAVLGRSLMGLQNVIHRTLTDVRVKSGKQLRERLTVVDFLDEVAATGVLHSEYRHIHFTVAPVDPALTVSGDPQLLTSAVMNLLHNAFKYTPTGGSVTLSAHAENGRVVIQVEDQCGGIPDDKGDLFVPFGDRRGSDRSGLGLGLSIARKAMRVQGGDIVVRNMPGKGCVFTIEMPLAVEPELMTPPSSSVAR